MHKKDYARFHQKWLSEKVGFPKSRKNTRFLLFTAPNLRYFLFGGQLYTKAHTTA